MKTDSTDAAWAAARAAEPDSMSRDQIATLLADVRRARSWLDAVEIRAARRIRALEAIGQAEPADSMIANASGCTSRDARTVTDRDTVCDALPDVEDAFSEGSITAAHVDAIAAASKSLPEPVRDEFNALSDDLLRRSAQVTLDSFGRECRGLAKQLLARSRQGADVDELAAQRAASNVKRWVDRVTGMHHTHLELDPLRDAKLHSAMQRELARLRAADSSPDRSWEQLKVDAFVNTIAGITTPASGPASGPASDPASDPVPGVGEPSPRAGAGQTITGPTSACGFDHTAVVVDRVPEITVLVSYDWLRGQVGTGVCETDNGTTLPIATVRRLCCDAEVLPMVLGGNSEVLDAGRSRRTASRGQRRALRAMHHSCAHPDCTVGFDACRIHHVDWWWEHNGPTDIDNLLPLCERHHHHVHEGGWTLTMTPDRVATWTRPDGTHHHTGTTINRTPNPTPEPTPNSTPNPTPEPTPNSTRNPTSEPRPDATPERRIA